MLVELAVSNLGVIDEISVALPPGLIALTGETGAGKTLLVDAIDLLMGGRADPGLVRPGQPEATVDGRFIVDDVEVVLTRAIPAEGRSRAYINGRPATASALADLGGRLVDLHGQHSHQSLLRTAAQRDALDRFGGVDLGRLEAARAMVVDIDRALAELGGDARSRARELDLLRYQVGELDGAGIDDPEEDLALRRREELLANAVEHRETGAAAAELLVGDDAARDQLANVVARLGDGGPFDDEASRLRDLLAELTDVGHSLRSRVEQIEHDPLALAAVQERRQLIQQLCRKYGDDLTAVMEEHRALEERLRELEGHDERAASLDRARDEARAELTAAESEVRGARVSVAPELAAAIERRLPDLAMPNAEVGIVVDGDAGEEVEFQLAANPGSPMQPLSKVASGGELARAMLALRNVLSEAPPILVFDEVDAGIGGEAGFAIGRSLAALADRHQVLVVTHLPQVAAFADAHLAVTKQQSTNDTVSEIDLLTPDARVTELARMLSGQPDSEAARTHAEELLAEAGGQRVKAPARRPARR